MSPSLEHIAITYLVIINVVTFLILFSALLCSRI